MSVDKHAVLQPPARWTEDERPGPHQVIRSYDDGETWHVIADVPELDDAYDVAVMLDELAQRRADL